MKRRKRRNRSTPQENSRRNHGNHRAAPRRNDCHLELLEDRRLLAAHFEWSMTPRVVTDADGRIAVPNNSAYAQPVGGFEGRSR